MILWEYVIGGFVMLPMGIAQYYMTDKKHGWGLIAFIVGWIAAIIWSGLDLV